MTENEANTETHPYSSCIELACKLNTDEKLYAAFLGAMNQGGEIFSEWLTRQGVPAELAQQIASQSGDKLYQTIGEVVCQRFW